LVPLQKQGQPDSNSRIGYKQYRGETMTTKRTGVTSTAIGCKVLLYRAQHDLTQADIARRSGLTQATISRIEDGLIENPTLWTLQALALAMRTTIEELLA